LIEAEPFSKEGRIYPPFFCSILLFHTEKEALLFKRLTIGTERLNFMAG